MQATHGNRKFVVGWKYNHSLPPDLLKAVGLTPSTAKAMKKKDLREKLRPILELLGMDFPYPSKVECFVLELKDGQNEEIGRRYISLRGDDGHDDEKARTFSLDKVLKYVFAGSARSNPENREIRKAIWDAYYSRKVKRCKEPVIVD